MSAQPPAEDTRIVTRGTLAAFAGATVLLLILLSQGNMWPVTLVLAAECATFGVLLLVLWRRRRGRVPWFEIGLVYATVVMLYAAYPLLRYVFFGGRFDFYFDSRWARLAPTAEDVAGVAWMQCAHLAAFVAGYLWIRGRQPRRPPTVVPPERSVLMAAVILYVASVGFWALVGLFYRTDWSTYGESYLLVQHLPLLVAQVANHLQGAQFPLSLVVLTALFANFKASRPLIVGWILAIAAMTVIRLGSRTELVLLLASSAMLYHTLVRPIPPKAIAAIGVLGLCLFVGLGLLRMGWLGSSASARPNVLAYPSEFDIVFANALDLAQLKARHAIGVVPSAVYAADFWALVPQQLAPLQKVDPSQWFVSTFYSKYAAAGGGLAFGTTAESVLAGGWLGAAVRGLALGAIFAGVHRLYMARGDRLWVYVLYVWLTVLSYQCLRATTFYLAAPFLFRFVPTAVAVTLLARALHQAAREARARHWVSPRPRAG